MKTDLLSIFRMYDECRTIVSIVSIVAARIVAATIATVAIATAAILEVTIGTIVRHLLEPT